MDWPSHRRTFAKSFLRLHRAPHLDTEASNQHTAPGEAGDPLDLLHTRFAIWKKWKPGRRSGWRSMLRCLVLSSPQLCHALISWRRRRRRTNSRLTVAVNSSAPDHRRLVLAFLNLSDEKPYCDPGTWGFWQQVCYPRLASDFTNPGRRTLGDALVAGAWVCHPWPRSDVDDGSLTARWSSQFFGGDLTPGNHRGSKTQSVIGVLPNCEAQAS